jgi:predicted transcriptional regulator of viral defense system
MGSYRQRRPSRRTQQAELLAYVERNGMVRANDVDELGINRAVLARAVADGSIERLGRGLYGLPDADVSAENSLAQAQARVPHGVVCLLSALRFHELGTQNPHEVWIAIDRKAWKPVVDYPPLRLVRLSGLKPSQGVREHVIDRVRVKITTPARTVADCFKYRNKVGLDVALEALRDFRRKRAGTIDELWEAARIDRVTRVLRPYAEALA